MQWFVTIIPFMPVTVPVPAFTVLYTYLYCTIPKLYCTCTNTVLYQYCTYCTIDLYEAVTVLLFAVLVYMLLFVCFLFTGSLLCVTTRCIFQFASTSYSTWSPPYRGWDSSPTYVRQQQQQQLTMSFIACLSSYAHCKLFLNAH